MMIHPLFGKAFAMLCCLVLVNLDNVNASSSRSREMIESYNIDSVFEGSSFHYTNDLKQISLKFIKTQGREHQVTIFKKGCAEEITNDNTYIKNIKSSSESIIPNTNNVEFTTEITFQSNIQDTGLFTVIEEDNLEEDLAQIELCARVDVFFVNPDEHKVSVNFKEVKFIGTILLDTIGVFNTDNISLRSENYKKFGVPPEWVTVENLNNEKPKKDAICMRLRNEDKSTLMREDEIEVQWTTSSCESPIDLPIANILDLNETADEVKLCSTYKHSDLIKNSMFKTRPGGGKVSNLCAKIRRHFTPENWEFGPNAGQDACVCMDLDINIRGNTRLLIEQDMPIAKGQEEQQGENINKLSRFLDDSVGDFDTFVENITISMDNPYEKEPTLFITSVGLSYETFACQCDENYECVNGLTLSQGSILYICLEVVNTQDVIIGRVSEFDIKQQQSGVDFTYTPIDNSFRDGFTDVIFQGQKAIIKHQLISRYFSDASPGPLDASGSMVLNFASSSNARRRVVEWKLPSQTEGQQGEEGSLELVGRVLGKKKQWSVAVVLAGSSTRSNAPAVIDGANRNQVLITLGVSAILAFIAVGIAIWRFERNDPTSSADTDVDGGPHVVSKSPFTLSREKSDRTWVLT